MACRCVRIPAAVLIGALVATSASTDGGRPRPLSLREAVQLAYERNRSFADALDRRNAAAINLESARSEFALQIQPSVGLQTDDGTRSATGSAGVEMSKRFATGTSLTARPAIAVQGRREAALSASLTQALLRGARREYNRSAVMDAEWQRREAERGLESERLRLTVATLALAYEVRRQRSALAEATASVDRLRSLTEMTRIKQGVGLAGSIDAYRAGIQLKQAEDERAGYRESLRAASDRLKLLLAIPLAEDVVIVAPLDLDVASMPRTELDDAWRRRVEIAQVTEATAEASRRTRNARHETLPSVDVVASFERGPLPAGASETADTDNRWWLALRLQSPPNARSLRLALRTRQLEEEMLKRRIALVEDQIAEEVRGEEAAFERAGEAVRIREEQEHEAVGQRELARVKFEHGLASNFDVVEAEQALRRARTTLVSARIDRIMSFFRWRAATGSLDPADLPETVAEGEP